ncbi:MAG: UvrD-helicase domain-containing protein [Bacilli bacterium]|nr:UvrD-helicase domain-containing protein [Bacilli bacterium]
MYPKYSYIKKQDIKKVPIINRASAYQNNKKYLKEQDKLYHELLDNINGYPLDKYQRKVVYSNEDHTIVIAGAGCGKTTTMIGKIKYLINVNKIAPEDIIAISFTNESANSLKNALENNNIYNVYTSTFHKLALNYVDKQNIVSDNYLDFIINEYFYSCNNRTKAIICKAFGISNYEELFKDNYINYKKMVKKTLMLCHTNDFTTKDFMKIKDKINKLFFKRLSLLCYLYLIIDLYYLYEEEKASTNAIDFDDMIIKATNNLSKHKLNTKYVIVDEYQDTSLIRVKFLQEFIRLSKAKLLVVGDDYQSIYCFNGCDINIFLNFKKYFASPKTFKLKNTYRNSQQLINISVKFILKNPFQINKKLISNKRLDCPIKIIYYNEKNKKSKFSKLLKYVNNNYGNYLVLGRNNFDINHYISTPINYLTVHKSKGLEADNIIIINLENSCYGFPIKIKDSKIEKIFFNNKQKYPYDEERRLFYVALTRTKNYVFLYVNKSNPSIFVKELIKDNEIQEIRI